MREKAPQCLQEFVLSTCLRNPPSYSDFKGQWKNGSFEPQGSRMDWRLPLLMCAREGGLG